MSPKIGRIYTATNRNNHKFDRHNNQIARLSNTWSVRKLFGTAILVLAFLPFPTHGLTIRFTDFDQPPLERNRARTLPIVGSDLQYLVRALGAGVEGGYALMALYQETGSTGGIQLYNVASYLGGITPADIETLRIDFFSTIPGINVSARLNSVEGQFSDPVTTSEGYTTIEFNGAQLHTRLNSDQTVNLIDFFFEGLQQDQSALIAIDNVEIDIPDELDPQYDTVATVESKYVAYSWESERPTFEIDIQIDNAFQLDALALHLRYDTNHLIFKEFTQKVDWPYLAAVHEEDGMIRIVGIAGDQPALYGSHILGQLIFQLPQNGDGQSQITIEEAKDDLAKAIIANGTITSFHDHESATATPTETDTPSSTPTPSNTPTATETEIPTETPIPSNTPTSTDTPTSSPTPSPTEAPVVAYQYRKYTVHFLRGDSPTVDGFTGLGEYAEADTAQSHWVNIDTDPPARDSEGTLFQAVYDAERLYVLVVYRDQDGLSTGSVTGDDTGFDVHADTVGIYVDPLLDEQNDPVATESLIDRMRGYLLAVNPNARLETPYTLTAAANNTIAFEPRAWNPEGIQVATGFRNNWIITEFSIPFRTLNLDGDLSAPNAPEDQTRWAVQLARNSSAAGNRRPVWNPPLGDKISSRPWGILQFSRTDSSIVIPETPPTSTPTPIPYRSLSNYVLIDPIAAFTPTPKPGYDSTQDWTGLHLRVEPKGWITDGDPVRFLAEARTINHKPVPARFSIPDLPRILHADFDPQVLRIPGSSRLKLEKAVSLSYEGTVPLQVELTSAGIDSTGQAEILKASQEVFVLYDPSLELSEPIPIHSRTIPIHLRTDSALDETIGDVVRIGGRLGAGGFTRIGRLNTPLIPFVDVYAKRGAGDWFYARVDVQEDYHFMVDIPIENEAMLDGKWRIRTQYKSDNLLLPIAAMSPELIIPVGALADAEPATKRKTAQTHKLHTATSSNLFGNLILVSGQGSSEAEETTFDEIAQRIYYDFVPGRRFTTETAKVISSRSLPAGDGEQKIEVISPASTNTLLNRIASIPVTDPLAISIFCSSDEDGNVRLSSGQLLDTAALGTALNSTARQAPTLLMIDAPRAAKSVQEIIDASGQHENLACIASTGAAPLNIAIFAEMEGTGQPVSFTDFFFDQIIAGEPIADSFEIARDHILELQGPIVLQNPVMFAGETAAFLNEPLGSAAVSSVADEGIPDTLPPTILDAPGNQEINTGSRLDIEAWIVDESGMGSDLVAGVIITPDQEETTLPSIELPLGYDADRDRFTLTIFDFPESVFGQVNDVTEFVFAIVAEDAQGNSADPAVSLITIIGEDALPPEQTITVEDADLDADGVVTSGDLRVLFDSWQNPMNADINHDGMLDAYDLQILQMFWGQEVLME